MNKLRKSLLIILTFIASTVLMGQEIVTVCDGTASNSNLPFRAELSKYDYHYQMIYPASDLVSLVEMDIKTMVFYIDPSAANGSLTGFQQGSWVVSLGETSATSLNNYDDTTPLTQVFSGQFTFTNRTVTVTFTQPYTYHGGNLLFDINHKKTTVDGVKLYFLGTTMDRRTAYGSTLPAASSSFLPKTTFSAEINTSCEQPQNLSIQVSDPFVNTAQVSWTGNSGTYEMQYKKTIETAWTSLGQTSNRQYTIETLSPHTEYLFRVRALCDDEHSNWLNGSFTTTNGIYAVPYTYDFELAQPFEDWNNIYGTSNLEDNIPSHSGTHALRFRGFSASLIALPQFSTVTNNLRLEFWTRPETDEDQCGSLAIGYMTDLNDGDSFVALKTYSYQEWSDDINYKKITVDLMDAPAGAFIAIRRFNNGTFYEYSWYVDDISVTTLPDCLEPLEPNASCDTENVATLSWTARNDETSWTVYYKKSTDANYTAVNVQTNPYTLTGLEAITEYEFYVVANCSSTDHSEPSEVVSFRTHCGVHNLPYTYDFESPVPFECWILFAGVDVDQNNEYSHSGTGYLKFGGNTTNLVALPQFSEPVNNLRLEFWCRPKDFISSSGTMAVGYLTDVDDASSFVEVQSFDAFSFDQNYRKITIEFDNVPSTAACIAFRHTLDFPYFEWWMDDISVEAIPTCREPINLAANNITTNSAELSWTARNGETSWTVYYKKSSEETYQSVNVSTNPNTTLTGLEGGNEYKFYVVSHCSGNDHSNPSEEAGFVTDCGTTVSVPYFYDFENDKQWNCWNPLSSDVIYTRDWESYSHSGNGCLEFKGNETSVVVLPQFTNATNTLRVTLWTQPYSYQYTESGDFAVGYLTNPNDPFTFTIIQTYHYLEWSERGCKKKIIDFNDAPADAYIAFKHYNCSNSHYWFVDDVSVTTIPSCVDPVQLTAENLTDHSAVLSWTAKNGESSWTLYYKQRSDATYTEVTEVTNPYTLTGLEAGTAYEYYVVAHCSDDDHSAPSEVHGFNTECGFELPYAYDFEDVPERSCWHFISGSYVYENDAYSHSGWGSLRFELTPGHVSNFAALPLLSASSNNLRMEFWTQPGSNSPSCGKLDVGYMTSLNDTTTFVAVATFASTDWAQASYYYNYERKVVELTDVPENAYIAFRHYNSGNYYLWNVDDVLVTIIPTCPEPTDLTVSNCTDHTATISWVETGDSDEWVVEYDTRSDFTEGMRVQVSGTPTLELQDLTTEATYYVRVYAKCSEADSSLYSAPIEFVASEKTYIIGPESNRSYFYKPISTNYHYSFTEQIYTVEELGEAGLIESVDFYMTSGGDITRNIDVYLVSTDKTNFTSANDGIPATEDDLVFSGSMSFVNDSWNTITFNKGFVYDGLHNVAIIVNDKTGSYTSPRYFSSSRNWGATGMYRSDSAPCDPANPVLNDWGQERNHIRLLKYAYGDCMRPRLLTVNEIKADNVTLSWVENGTANAWKVHYEYTDDEQVLHEAEVETTDNPFILTELLPETTYSVKVSPSCAGENAIWCNAVTFTTKEACPIAFDLTVNNITSATADLSWNGDPDVESYAVRYRNAAIVEAPYMEGFEDEDAFLDWQFINLSATTNMDYVGRTTNSSRSGEWGFSFSSHDYSSQYDQYLVSPELTETGTLQFYYRSSSYMTEMFRVGYSTSTNDLEAFTWGEDQVCATQSWTAFTMELPNNAKYFAIHYFTNCHLQLYVDDITINAYEVAAGEWQNVICEETFCTVTGLTAETDYEAQVKSGCSEDGWSNLVTFTTIPGEYVFSGSGTQDDPYLITSAEDWRGLSENLQNHYSYTGKYFLQTNDFSVRGIMVGLGTRFEGVYDGGGNTLTFYAGTPEMPQNNEYCAPFRAIGNATIKNLNIDGAIYTTAKRVGGLAGSVESDLLVTNCRSTITFANYSFEDYTSHSGFISYVHNGMTTVEGCVFQGTLLGNGTRGGGGFVGYTETAYGARTTINDCFFDPVVCEWPATWSAGNGTFARAGNASLLILGNNYYTKTLDYSSTQQGIQVYMITIDDTEHLSMDYGEIQTSYDNSQLSIINNGIICYGKFYSLDNKTHQLLLENIPQGFAIQVRANGVVLPISNSQCSFTVNGQDVTIATELTGVGEPIYEINSTDDWNLMALMIHLGYVDYTSQPVNLNADITVSTSAGTSIYPFRGTFNGNGHTITFQKGTAEMPDGEQYCALFPHLGDATIQDLNIEGSIYTSEKFAGGLAGLVEGNLTIVNCRSGITLNSTINGDGSHGGFVGYAHHGAVSFTGCVFNGQLLGNRTSHCGGFVGWTSDNNASVTLTDCFFDAAEITFNSEGSQTFARASSNNSLTFVNSGYYTAFGGGQGIKFQNIRPEYPSMLSITGWGGETTLYDCSGLSLVANGISYNDAYYGNQNHTIPILLQPHEGYAISDVMANGVLVEEDGSGYLIPVANEDVLITATMTLVSDPIYEINTTGDWNLFVMAVASGHEYVNETVNLNDDISVTEMVGVEIGIVFRGTFEGNGHTITVNYNSDDDFCAPFAYTYGATIRNLAVAGTINTSGRYAGGVVGRNGTARLTLIDVTSSVTINSTHSGNAYHGGLVGYAINSTFEGCVFNGSLLGANSNGCGGLLGWIAGSGDSSAIFTNCLFIPTNVTIGTSGSYTFFKQSSNNSGATLSNCYYLQTFGTAQGQRVFRIIPDEGVSAANEGTVNNAYDVSDLTLYEAGIQYHEDLFACNGETVRLYLESTPTPGCFTDYYLVDAGTLNGTLHSYTLVMPNQNVLISLAPTPWDGDGTKESPFLIYTFYQWKMLASRVNSGSMTYSGEYFKLMKDITITENFASGTPTTMVGISENVSFQGNFDGNGHTITLNIKDTNDDHYCAPFRLVKNATIKRLHVTGVIEKTRKKHAAGFIGQSYGNTYIVACRSSVNIISGTDGDGSNGGFVGDVRGGTINFYNCLFDGEFNGPNTTKWGGFVGYLADDKDANFINCLFDPKSINIKNDGNRTFIRSGDGCDITYSRTFYTSTCGNAQAYNYHDYNEPLGVAWNYDENGRLAPIMNLYTFEGEGTEASPYLVDEWYKLVVNVNMGETYSGKYLQMTNDWNVHIRDGHAMVGLTEDYSFQGTFDGNGHQFYYYYSEDYNTDEYSGPFQVIKNATIKRTHFRGTIYKEKKKYGGLIGQAFGTNHIISCRSSMEINSEVNGDGSHGGFLGIIRDGSTYFIDCLFDGSLLGYSTTKWGGFVGWVKDGKDAYFINCLFNPDAINIYDRSDSREFARYDNSGDIHITNSYRKNYLNNSQGIVVPSDWSDEHLRDALGAAWEIITDNNNQNRKVVPIISPRTLNGSGTLESPYLIDNTDDWNALALHVRSGSSYAGKYVQLTNDITINSMVGSTIGDIVYPFSGIFDGNGHTLNLNLTGSGEYAAPFAYISGATIKNLHLTGTISTTGIRPAGISSFVVGNSNSTITNCWSEVAISSSFNGGIAASGFVARVNASITIEGCLFTGSITYSHANGKEGGGFVGWTIDGASATLNDCVFAPSNISISNYTDQRMFVGGRVRGTLNNCYYDIVAAATGYTKEGKELHSITAGEGITVTNAGTATEYNVSGITGYGTGIALTSLPSLPEGEGVILCAGNGDQVSLNLERETEPGFSSAYTVTAGTLNGTTNPYTLTMPNQDVVITAETVLGDWDGTGTEEDPYIIYTWQQLDLLSERVNGPHGQSTNTFEGKFFLIGNDIEYPHESDWDDLESYETNYTAIGTGWTVCFKGTLDGDGHTISGIRIYNNYLGMYQGLFGYLSGTVKNLTIADTRIVGRDYDGGCGAIVGYNDGGIVSNCHVTSTVAIHIIREGYSTSYCGGVVGYNRNSGAVVSDCSSAVRITAAPNLTKTHYIGGIVGMNYQGVMRDNLAIGATVTPADDHYYSTYGAIAAYNNSGTMERNYYGNCTVDGVLNTTNVGCNSTDIIANDGAVPCPSLTVAGYSNSDNERGGYVLLASPIGTVNPEHVNNMLSNEYDLYAFDQNPEDGLEWRNYKANTFDLEPGQGYLYANSEDVVLLFPGAPYTGGVEVELSKTGDGGYAGWNLVGNPYNETAYIDKEFYTMNDEGSEIIASEETSIAPMEGVFVIAENDGETLSFSTTPVQSKGQLVINVTQDRGRTMDRAIVKIGNRSNLPKFQLNPDNTKVYIRQDDSDYAVVGSEKFGRMPVSFKPSHNGTYTLSVESENLVVLELMLIDHKTGREVNLHTTPSYRFEAEAMDRPERFELVYKTSDIPQISQIVKTKVFGRNANGEIIINGTGTLQVIDMLGRELFSRQVTSDFRLPTSVFSTPGVYVLRLITGEEELTQKIVIE